MDLFFSFLCLTLRLQPTIQPTEEDTLEKHTVLRLCNPVTFIREDQHLGRYATKLGCIERAHALSGKDSVIQFSVSDENRRIPFVHEEMRGIGVRLLSNGIALPL